jgi:hypothetical protein
VLEVEIMNVETTAICITFKCPKAIIIAGNTDCIAGQYCDAEYIKQCRAITGHADNNDIISLLGTTKREQLIKV